MGNPPSRTPSAELDRWKIYGTTVIEGACDGTLWQVTPQ
jgi:hypothetical protein